MGSGFTVQGYINIGSEVLGSRLFWNPRNPEPLNPEPLNPEHLNLEPLNGYKWTSASLEEEANNEQ